MFVQVVQGKVRDADAWTAAMNDWERDVRPHAQGFLGVTGGITDDGQAISLARFESAEAAAANSGLDVQHAWYEKAKSAIDGAMKFIDCTDVDLLYGGGDDDAGFVQIMQVRVKDPEVTRSGMADMEAELRDIRPDLLGGVLAWHPDGRTFTQASYFTSEEEARTNEKVMADHPSFQKWSDNIDGAPTFYDLHQPHMS